MSGSGVLAAAARVIKRKRSSDAVSEGTHTTDYTDVSNVDERAQQLADKRGQHAASRLQLEERLKQLDEQKQHVAAQLEQLEGCEGGKDLLGVSDMRQQLKDYEQQHSQASMQLADLDKQFETAVADILGIAASQQPQLLAEAVKEQQQLQDVQVQQLAVEQQLAAPDFAVTDSSKHKAKKARLERMDSVWVWLQQSNAAEGPHGVEQPPQGLAQQQPEQQQPEQQPHAGQGQHVVQLGEQPEGPPPLGGQQRECSPASPDQQDPVHCAGPDGSHEPHLSGAHTAAVAAAKDGLPSSS